jgi:hypothetical protein
VRVATKVSIDTTLGADVRNERDFCSEKGEDGGDAEEEGSSAT